VNVNRRASVRNGELELETAIKELDARIDELNRPTPEEEQITALIKTARKHPELLASLKASRAQLGQLRKAKKDALVTEITAWCERHKPRPTFAQ
jgi:hypothetical protein